jgi:nicotinamidase/pyrazinamidase
MAISMKKGDGLLIIDVQRDFCPGGSLAVPGADEILPVLNASIAVAHKMSLPIFASRDWHPPRHISFKERGGPWPPHCVQDTAGAEFHPSLSLPPETVMISKGQDPDRDQYSAFDETGLTQRLRKMGVTRLFVGGLAQEVCVKQSVLAGLREGFKIHLMLPATRPLDFEKGKEAVREMKEAGAVLVEEIS